MKMTKSQKAVLELIENHHKNGMTSGEICGQLPFASRTVRYALRGLMVLGKLKRVPNFGDLRQWIYFIPK